MKGFEMRLRTNLNRPQPDSRPQLPKQPSVSERHDVAVVQAEARRLAHALRPFGVLRKDQLKVVARAASWHEGSFDRALRAAVEAGEIERLPFDFYRPRSAPLD